MPGEVFIGVDLGTQSVTANIADLSGNSLSQASRMLHSTRMGTSHEQSPNEWISASRGALGSAINALSADERQRITGICFCGTSGTIALVDDAGSPVSAGLMYDDTRAAGLAPEIRDIGRDRWQVLGYQIQPTWALTKIVQLARDGCLQHAYIAHQPDIIAADAIGCRVPSDSSSALKSGFDLLESAWPNHIHNELGLDTSRLPDVVTPGTALGISSVEWERSTGVPAGTVVVAGMTDGCAAQLGAGAVGEGDWHSVIGTTLVLKGVSRALTHDSAGAVYSHQSPISGLWLPGGASNTGSRAIDVMFPKTYLPELEQHARPLWDERSDAISPVYPLIGQGERFPFVEPDATGFAIQDNRTRDLCDLGNGPEAYVSILMGVACIERLCIERLAELGAPLTGNLSTSGGGTNSHLWTLIRATVLERPMTVAQVAEPSMGMAILAASASKGYDLIDAVNKMVTPEHTIYPESGAAEFVDTMYASVHSELRSRGWI